MKRIVALLLLVLLLAGCGAVAEEVPLAPIDPAPAPSMGDEVSGGEETPPLPAHIHEFSEATCTEAKTCACGETEGEAKGHSWNDATCTVPKTCQDCGKTQGAVVSHNYQDGACAVCGASAPQATEAMVWIPQSGTKYHSNPSCSNMKNPTEVTEEVATQRGFTPCKKCY